MPDNNTSGKQEGKKSFKDKLKSFGKGVLRAAGSPVVATIVAAIGVAATVATGGVALGVAAVALGVAGGITAVKGYQKYKTRRLERQDESVQNHLSAKYSQKKMLDMVPELKEFKNEISKGENKGMHTEVDGGKHSNKVLKVLQGANTAIDMLYNTAPVVGSKATGSDKALAGIENAQSLNAFVNAPIVPDDRKALAKKMTQVNKEEKLSYKDMQDLQTQTLETQAETQAMHKTFNKFAVDQKTGKINGAKLSEALKNNKDEVMKTYNKNLEAEKVNMKFPKKRDVMKDRAKDMLGAGKDIITNKPHKIDTKESVARNESKQEEAKQEKFQEHVKEKRKTVGISEGVEKQQRKEISTALKQSSQDIGQKMQMQAAKKQLGGKIEPTSKGKQNAPKPRNNSISF